MNISKTQIAGILLGVAALTCLGIAHTAHVRNMDFQKYFPGAKSQKSIDDGLAKISGRCIEIIDQGVKLQAQENELATPGVELSKEDMDQRQRVLNQKRTEAKQAWNQFANCADAYALARKAAKWRGYDAPDNVWYFGRVTIRF